MAVAGGDAVAVREVDGVAQTADAARLDDQGVAGGDDLLAPGSVDVDAAVEGPPLGEGIPAVAEAAGQEPLDRGDGRGLGDPQVAFHELVLQRREMVLDLVGPRLEEVQALAAGILGLPRLRRGQELAHFDRERAADAGFRRRGQLGDAGHDRQLVHLLVELRQLVLDVADRPLEDLVVLLERRVLLLDLVELAAVERGAEVEDGGGDAAEGEDRQAPEYEAGLEGCEAPLAELGPRVGDEDDRVLFQCLTT